MERRFWVGRSLPWQHGPWLLSPVLISCTITTGPPAGSQPAQTPPPAPAATAPPPATAAPASTSPAPATAGAMPAPSATETYNPCAGKNCGDRCNLCPPKTPGCFETALVKLCHPDNQCKPATTVDCSKPAGG